MQENDIDNLIGHFEGYIIEKIDFDYFLHKISINIKTDSGDGVYEQHFMIFEDVSAYFYEYDVFERRLNVQQWKVAEISEIHYYSNPEDMISFLCRKPGFPLYQAFVNFYIEIWNSVLLIEAKTINIDGIQYKS